MMSPTTTISALKEKNPKCRYIDNSKKIIRIEIRCFKKKVRHLTKKFKCTSASSFLKESDIIENTFSSIMQISSMAQRFL